MISEREGKKLKWNDRFLPYSGENKIVIYNYLISTIKKLLREKNKETLTNFYIINYILNDADWDIDIFKSKEKHDWFIAELKNNPYLLDFVNSEITKVVEYPDIYSKEVEQTLKLDNEKTDTFAQVIQSFVMNSPTTRHFYFNSIDLEEVRKNTDEYVKANFMRFRCRRNTLEQRYFKMCKVQKVLKEEMGISTTIVPTGNNGLLLIEENGRFTVNITQWGDFPVVYKKSEANELFCMVDDISIYIFGIVSADNIKKYSSDHYLFTKDKKKTEHLTAFYGFSNDIFKTERGYDL